MERIDIEAIAQELHDTYWAPSKGYASANGQEAVQVLLASIAEQLAYLNNTLREVDSLNGASTRIPILDGSHGLAGLFGSGSKGCHPPGRESLSGLNLERRPMDGDWLNFAEQFSVGDSHIQQAFPWKRSLCKFKLRVERGWNRKNGFPFRRGVKNDADKGASRNLR